MPVKIVVPNLPGIVEDLRLIGVAGGGLDDVLEGLVGELRPSDQLVQRVDVGLVVFAIVEPDRLGRNGRRQSALGIG